MKRIILSFIAATISFTSAEEAAFTEYEVEGMNYRVFEPKARKPSYKLLVFIPGGTGGADFTPWCETIYRLAIPDDFIAVQMIAPPWSNRSNIWPSDLTPTKGMPESIDEIFSAMIRKIGKVHEIEDDSVFTFSWSSGGPAAYLIAATQPEVKGHFVAMSVFREEWLPKQLRKVKGQRFFLYHSPDDTVCDIRLARKAEEVLTEEKAKVKMKTYPGGHGWAEGSDHFAAIRGGLAWLTAEEN